MQGLMQGRPGQGNERAEQEVGELGTAASEGANRRAGGRGGRAGREAGLGRLDWLGKLEPKGTYGEKRKCIS